MKLLRHCTIAFAVLAFAASVHAQVATTRIVVGFPPGTGLDAMTRMIADRLSITLKQTHIVENRPGDASRIATEHVKNATADGATLLMTPFAPMVINPFLYSRLRYDPVTDFAPIAHVASFGFAFATGIQVPASSVAEYIAAVKNERRFGQYSSAGAGSLPHFFSLVFAREAGVEMVHVNYKGTAPALNDLAGGHIAAFIGTESDLKPMHVAGKIRVIATSGSHRSRAYPDIPTFSESGFRDLIGRGWYGLYAPAKTPAGTVERLSTSVLQVLSLPEVRGKLEAMGMEVTGLPPAQLSAIQKADSEKWGPVIRASGIRLEE
jgi:tripartite-type tricarboxylate transporter receptor subunit TctC